MPGPGGSVNPISFALSFCPALTGHSEPLGCAHPPGSLCLAPTPPEVSTQTQPQCLPSSLVPSSGSWFVGHRLTMWLGYSVQRGLCPLHVRRAGVQEPSHLWALVSRLLQQLRVCSWNPCISDNILENQKCSCSPISKV